MLHQNEEDGRIAIEEYIRGYNQSLQELKYLLNESEFAMCNVFIIVNEVNPEFDSLKTKTSSRTDDVIKANLRVFSYPIRLKILDMLLMWPKIDPFL